MKSTVNTEELDTRACWTSLFDDAVTFFSAELIQLLSQSLDMHSFGNLDIAVSSNASRPYWMMLLHSLRGGIIDDWCHSISSLMWLVKRGIRATRVQLHLMYADASRVRGCDLLLLETDDIVHLGLTGCYNLTDQCIMDMVNRCHKLTGINLDGCDKVTDVGVSALSAGCGQLQSINLEGCFEVTDVGVSALGTGCGQLQSISLYGCNKVTDVGVSVLGAGCGQLRSIDLYKCRRVTDAGISALGRGCGQLQTISLRCCDKVTDAGISALGVGCGQLQSINLSRCDKVTDAVVSALSHIVIRR